MRTLNERIESALDRIKNGNGQMRIPADPTDPDLVLVACQERIAALESELAQARQQLSEPIDMLLLCPNCGLQHVDAPDERTPGWTNPPHKSHLCHACAHIWRPSDRPTNGAALIATKGDRDRSPIPDSHLRSQLKLANARFCEAHAESSGDCPCCAAVHVSDQLKLAVEALENIADVSEGGPIWGMSRKALAAIKERK